LISDPDAPPQEKLVDEAIMLALVLERLARSAADDIAGMLSDLRQEILQLVVRHDPTALRYEANRRSRLQLLVEEAQSVVSAAYVAIANRSDQHLQEVADLTQDSSNAILALLLVIKGLSRRLNAEELRAARNRTLIEGATVRDWWARQSGDMKFRIQRSLEGAMLVESLDQQVTLQDLVEVVRSDEPGSLFSPVLRNAVGLIYSAVHAVASTVRLETARRHPEFFAAVQHLSVIDQRTTTICLSRSNRRWALDGTAIGHSLPFRVPPLHFRCRSHLVPVLHPYADMPQRVQRRLRPEDFSGRSSPEPDLAAWLASRGVTRSDEPIDIAGARDQMGL
jgi:hypothetical protein